MATLYLHIGHGKTGTSWIQSCLRLSRATLRDQRIEYGIGADADITEPEVITSGNATCLLESKEAFESVLEKCQPNKGNSLLFSSEYIFPHFIHSNAETYIENIAFNHGFDRVKILLFIRNPISNAISVWLQRIKRAGMHHITLDNMHQYGEVGLVKIFNVATFIDKIFKCKGVELMIRNYSVCKYNLINEVTDWLEVPNETIKAPTINRINRSLTLSEMTLQRELNRVLGPSGDILSDPLCERLPDIEPDHILPPIFVQEAIWKEVYPTIERINKFLPEAHHYQCDIKEPSLMPEQINFTKEQINVIAEGLGGRIAKLQRELESSLQIIEKLNARIQILES